VVLESTETLDHNENNNNENHHIMIKLQLDGRNNEVAINAMIDSGATEDFINRNFCHKYNIRTTKAKKIQEIHLAEGQPSIMGPVTHIVKVPISIGSHRELATFRVANLPNHEVIHSMPWLRNHDLQIDWGQGKITFESERCTTWCLKESPMVFAITEDKAQEKNLEVEFGEPHIQKNKKLSKRIQVQRMDQQAKVSTKGTKESAGHDLYANERKTIPAKGQEVVDTGIALALPKGTYGRIAPRRGLVVRHQLTINARVIDRDYMGEVRVVMVNLGNTEYEVKTGDKIAQIITEKIVESECYEARELEKTQ